MNKDWKNYQEDVRDFFQSIGLDAETDKEVKGVRTSHDVDVLVKSKHAGFEVTWIVECKLWTSKVNKLHVLALREIVNDTGADKGILLAEHGVQSGAIEAANLTNVTISTLAELSVSSQHEVLAMRMRDLYNRLSDCKDAYWDIPKYTRIDYGLRPDVSQVGYSGRIAIEAAEDLLSKGFRNVYPVPTDDLHLSVSEVLLEYRLPKDFASAQPLVETVEYIISDLESRIDKCITDLKERSNQAG